MSLETSREENPTEVVNEQEVTQDDKAAVDTDGVAPKFASRPENRSTWRRLRAGVKRQNPISKWLSSSGSSEDKPPDSKWPGDAKESGFCNALIGLMDRSGEYHDLAGDKEENGGSERETNKSK